MAKQNNTKVVTGIVRLSYANVWEPKSINGGDPKYSCSIIIPKTDTETVNAINAAIDCAIKEGIGKFGGKVPPKGALKLPLRDGDTERDDDNYVGCYFINANSKTAPQIVDKRVRPIQFVYESGFLFVCLPSGRRLAYVKPRIGENRFGGESVTYEGVGGTKKWERLESYGPKFVENIVQALSRDILCYAMKTLRCCNIVAHVHDEIIIEADPRVSLEAICEQMGRTPPWAKGLILRADGYETPFYKKD